MEALRDALPKVWALLSESVNLLFSVFTLFIMLLYVVFILMDYESISQGWVGLLPPKYRPFTVRLLTDIKEGMNRYFRGQTLVAFCVGVLFSIGFLIIDFPLAIGLGMLIGLLNLVPYLQIIGFIPTVLLAILKTADTGGNFWFILGSALLVFVVVQVIQDGFLVPRIMGHITGLNPAIILLSLSVWGYALGIIGLILALPVTTLAISYYKRYVVGDSDILDNKLDPETIAVAKEAGIYVEKPVTHDTMPDKQPDSTVSPAQHTNEQQEVPHFTTTVKEGESEKRTE